MPPLFTTFLADRLNARSRIQVSEASAGAKLEPGVAMLAPGDWHMELERSGDTVLIRVHQGPQENSCRPAADVLFRSVVSAYGHRVLAVVLTGMVPWRTLEGDAAPVVNTLKKLNFRWVRLAVLFAERAASAPQAKQMDVEKRRAAEAAMALLDDPPHSANSPAMCRRLPVLSV